MPEGTAGEPGLLTSKQKDRILSQLSTNPDSISPNPDSIKEEVLNIIHKIERDIKLAEFHFAKMQLKIHSLYEIPSRPNPNTFVSSSKPSSEASGNLQQGLEITTYPIPEENNYEDILNRITKIYTDIYRYYETIKEKLSVTAIDSEDTEEFEIKNIDHAIGNRQSELRFFTNSISGVYKNKMEVLLERGVNLNINLKELNNYILKYLKANVEPPTDFTKLFAKNIQSNSDLNNNARNFLETLSSRISSDSIPKVNFYIESILNEIKTNYEKYRDGNGNISCVCYHELIQILASNNCTAIPPKLIESVQDSQILAILEKLTGLKPFNPQTSMHSTGKGAKILSNNVGQLNELIKPEYGAVIEIAIDLVIGCCTFNLYGEKPLGQKNNHLPEYLIRIQKGDVNINGQKRILKRLSYIDLGNSQLIYSVRFKIVKNPNYVE